MKTTSLKALLFLLALTSVTAARADESLADRVKDFFKEPPHHAPTSVAAVRG